MGTSSLIGRKWAVEKTLTSDEGSEFLESGVQFSGCVADPV